MAARITYNSVNVDFNIKYDSFSLNLVQERGQNRSGSGKIETINQYGIIEASFQGIFTGAQYRSMIGFWSWARQGKPFSFAAYSSLTESTVLSGAATAGTVILTNSSQFSIGDLCLIRSADYDEFEMVQISSVTASTSASLSSTLVFDYAAGDTFRHMYYLPDAILINTNFDPMEMDKSGFYKFDFQVIEAL